MDELTALGLTSRDNRSRQARIPHYSNQIALLNRFIYHSQIQTEFAVQHGSEMNQTLPSQLIVQTNRITGRVECPEPKS